MGKRPLSVRSWFPNRVLASGEPNEDASSCDDNEMWAMTLLDIRIKELVIPHYVGYLVADLNRCVESAVHISEQLIARDRNEINKRDLKTLVVTDMLLLRYEPRQDDRNEGLQTILSQTIDITFRTTLKWWRINVYKLRR